ncbi:MAG TPA: hypothetical protein VGD29_06770 [Actinoplanes sp.]
MIRRDLLSGEGKREHDDNNKDIRIELEPADHEEPTWEVRPAGQARRRRIDGRTRTILSVAAAAAIVVNAGAAWTYWRITESKPGGRSTGTAVELTLRARNDLNRPLTPGGAGNLTVTVANEYDFPIRIKLVTPGSGNIVADDEHRDAGCTAPGVSLTRPRFDVSWDVPRNTVGAFTIPGGLFMSRGSQHACKGATYTVPVQVTGYSTDPA